MANDTELQVNPVLDLKGPLKGKGGTLAQWRDQVEQRLARTYREMDELSQESRSIEGRSFALFVYVSRGCAKQLRWRMTNSRHTTWARVEPALAQMSPGLARWYAQAHELSLLLNHREQTERYDARTVGRLMEGIARTPIPYEATVGRGTGGGRPSPIRAVEPHRVV